MTPVASEIVIKSISPLGNIPKRAAAVVTTASNSPALRTKYASIKSKMPIGIIAKLVKRVTFFIEFTNSEVALLYFFVSLVMCAAKLSLPTFTTLAYPLPLTT